MINILQILSARFLPYIVPKIKTLSLQTSLRKGTAGCKPV